MSCAVRKQSQRQRDREGERVNVGKKKFCSVSGPAWWEGGISRMTGGLEGLEWLLTLILTHTQTVIYHKTQTGTEILLCCLLACLKNVISIILCIKYSDMMDRCRPVTWPHTEADLTEKQLCNISVCSYFCAWRVFNFVGGIGEKPAGWHHLLLMSQHIAGPCGADMRDHVVCYRVKRDTGEGGRRSSEKHEGKRGFVVFLNLLPDFTVHDTCTVV